MPNYAPAVRSASLGFPNPSAGLERFGFKSSAGGAHASRTMMLEELGALLATVPPGSDASAYREAILRDNALRKNTLSTREKSLRHLRELYALDEKTPIFGVLRKLHVIDDTSLPLLALLAAWARDPLLRATTAAILESSEGDRVDAQRLREAFDAVYPHDYPEPLRDKIARNAASSWTQSGHLNGRIKKTRHLVTPTATAVTMAMFLGTVAGYHGVNVFANPWARLLDMTADRARTLVFEAHRAGLLNFRSVGEVVELSFPLLAQFEDAAA